MNINQNISAPLWEKKVKVKRNHIILIHVFSCLCVCSKLKDRFVAPAASWVNADLRFGLVRRGVAAF